MSLSAIALCSRALIKIGAEPLSSFEEGTAESLIAASLFPTVRDGLLSSYPWSFATAQRVLKHLAAQPVADYAYAYQLPPDFLRALSAGSGARGRGLPYRILGGRLHSDAEEVVLSYIFRPGEADFPPFFAQALILRLAAEFCLPITESTSRAEALTKLAEEETRRARLVDSQQDLPERFEDFSLVGARRS